MYNTVAFLWLRGGFSENLDKGFLPELPEHLYLLLLVASLMNTSVLCLCLTLVADGRYVGDQHVRHDICELAPWLAYAFSLFELGISTALYHCSPLRSLE